jgi:hypothetical protein
MRRPDWRRLARACAPIILAICGSAILAAAAPSPAAAAASVKHPASEGNMLLLDIRLEQHVLSDSLTAYQLGQQVFLPLGELAHMLTIGIRTRPADGTARGFVRGEERIFSLDVARGTASIGEKIVPFNPELVSVRGNDIYVESKLLASWLLVDFDISLSNLSVALRPREPLPLQLRLNRELQLAALGGRAEAEPDYPLTPVPYALAGVPFVDQTVTLGAGRVNGATNRNAALTTFIKGDLLGLQASAYISGSNQPNSRQSRLTLGRDDPQGTLLGPLKATSFAVGSVSVPGIANVASTSETGDGFSISNSPLDRPTNFNSHTLQGDLPPGWDVELFFNEALVAYQQARADGKYVFADQPLVYGPNEFRLVFHGPQGQLRVERHNFLIDESIAVPGSFFYNIGSHRDLYGKQQSSLHAEWGLGAGLTATADSVARQSSLGAATRYDSAGLRGFLGALVFNANVTRSSTGGSLAELGMKTRLGGMAIDAGHIALRDFSSDMIPATPDPIRARDRLRVDGLLPGDFMRTMPVTLEVQREQLRSGSSTFGANALISRSAGEMSLSNLLHWSSAPGTRSLDGALQVASNVGELRLRGQVNYDLKPGARLSAIALSSDSSLAAGYLLNVSATRTFATGEARLNASLNKSMGSYAVALNVGVGKHGEALAGIQLFTSFGREPRKSQWIFDALPMTGSGAVSARVFIDRNGNGVMDAGELPVADAGFVVNGGQYGARTGADGIAYLDHLPVNRNVNLSVNVATLEDPQLSTRHKGVRVVPRQGNVAQLDFPLALTGEIDGTVFLRANGSKRGIGNVLLELVSATDGPERVVAQVRSSADGFFIVQDVVPGSYQLRIAAQQLEELRLADPGPRLVKISDTGSQVNGQNFTLAPR